MMKMEFENKTAALRTSLICLSPTPPSREEASVPELPSEPHREAASQEYMPWEGGCRLAGACCAAQSDLELSRFSVSIFQVFPLLFFFFF